MVVIIITVSLCARTRTKLRKGYQYPERVSFFPYFGVFPPYFFFLIYKDILTLGEKILLQKLLSLKSVITNILCWPPVLKKLTGKEVCMLNKKLRGWVVVKRHPAALSQCRVLIEP